jgi:hypothetical protein
VSEVRLWRWIITDEVTKRRRMTTYRMTEEQARQRHGADAGKVEWSLEVRTPGQSTSVLRHVTS